MASFLNRIVSAFKTKKSKPKNISITVNVMGTDITVNSAEIHSTKEDLANLRNKRNRRYRRYDRLMRHKKIWAVLSYAKSLEAIYNSNNFYDLDKALLDYHNAMERFDESDFHPSENDKLCAFRFCDIQNCMGICEHRLSDAEKQSISNWSTYTLDYTSILEIVSKRFITYLNGGRDTYRINGAYLNRLEYLIKHLDEVRHRKDLSTIPRIDDYINKLQVYYEGIKSTAFRDNDSISKETVEP